MAEDTELSRTEPPSAKRLREARSRGDVPRSAEWSGWLLLLAGAAALAWLAPQIIAALRELFASTLGNAARPLDSLPTAPVFALVRELLLLLGALFAAALVAPLLLSGWVYAPAAARADFSRLLRRILTADAWFAGALGMLKLVLAGSALAWAVSAGWRDWQALVLADPAAGLARAADWVGRGLIVLVAALALVAVLDAGWRWWRYLRRHAMSWREVLAEAREYEVAPELRARLRARQHRAGLAVNPSADTPPEGKAANARSRAIDEVIG